LIALCGKASARLKVEASSARKQYRAAERKGRSAKEEKLLFVTSLARTSKRTGEHSEVATIESEEDTEKEKHHREKCMDDEDRDHSNQIEPGDRTECR
jgi:hypothetical protein